MSEMGLRSGFCVCFYGVITPDLRGVGVQGFTL